MKGTLSKDVALLVLRLSGLGLAFAHGWPKVIRMVSGDGGPFIDGVAALGFPAPFVFAWAATLAEFAGGFAITLGLFTRIAAAFAAFTMFVASVVRHQFVNHVLVFFGARSVPEDVIDGWGNPERAVTYFLIFAALALLGGGRFALDRFLRKGS